VHRSTIALVNRTISTINSMYDSSYGHSAAAAVPRPPVSCRQPDNLSGLPGPPLFSSFPLDAFVSSCSIWSAAQRRLTRRICAEVVSFLLTARRLQPTTCTAGDMGGMNVEAILAASCVGETHRAADASSPLSVNPLYPDYASQPPPPVLPGAHSLGPPPVSALLDTGTLPLSSTHSGAATVVVPLVAERVSLPASLNIVPLLSILPPAVAARYQPSAAAELLRPLHEVAALDLVSPLRGTARVAGSRHQYVRLIARMSAVGMLGWTDSPKAVNGVFTVGKDDASDRLIIDAQPANRLFIDYPHVELPSPTHLLQLQLPPDKRVPLFCFKSDLSNYYHHIGLPAWLCEYFALPPLTPDELLSIGLDPVQHARFPMCVTMPMGWSHAVFCAQTAHEHIVYSSSTLQPEDNILSLNTPLLSGDDVRHGICIDDTFGFSLSRAAATRTLDALLECYRRAGFIVKESKVVRPTSSSVKVIGFDIHGAAGTVSLSVESRLHLLCATAALLRRGVATGTELAHIVGRWTWCVLVRRAALSLFQRVYQFIEVAGRRRFTLWPSVRRELRSIMAVVPLLQASLRSPLFHRAVASDASELAAGVVSTPLTPALEQLLWPLCSSRQHATLQTLCNSERGRAMLADGATSPQHDYLATAAAVYGRVYSAVAASPWTTLVSSRWQDATEHINTLELRAALLAVHWLLSYPSSLTSRAYLLVDSTAAFFSLWKGRSSSPRLLLVLRKICALLLASGLMLMVGWLPSAVNPADAPSRQ